MFFIFACTNNDPQSNRTSHNADFMPTNELISFHEIEDGFDLSTIFTLEYSILSEILKARQSQNSQNVRYPICINLDAERTQIFLGFAQKSMKMWNDALIGYGEWDVLSVEPELVGDSESCPDMHDGLRVYKLIPEPNNNERSGAAVHKFTFLIGTHSSNYTDWRVFAHEYGHQIGLGDTYTEPGYQQPVGQPAAIMNNLYALNTLSEDDIDGIRHVWDRLRGATQAQCPLGYTIGQTNENRNNHNFCVKSTSANSGIELLNADSVEPGQPIIVNYVNIPSGVNHWVGLYQEGDPNENFIRYVFIDSGSGTVKLDGPNSPGNYEIRLFYNDSYNLEGAISFSIDGVASEP